MQKIRKHAEVSFVNDNRPSRRYGAVTLPEVIDIDELGNMLDEDLFLRFRSLDEDRNRALEQGRPDLVPWEVEIAYVRREQQIRRDRRDAHAEALRKADQEVHPSENSLPSGDFDNYSFVYAAVGGRARWN